MVFAYGGFMFGHMGNIPLFQGLPWMPVLLIALERLRHRARLRDGLLGAAAVALALLTGHPHIPAYTLMVAALYVAFFTLLDRPATGRLRYAGAAALAVAAGMALAAVQLVPGAELAAQSARPGLTYEDFASFALPARQLPMLLFPSLFGGRPGVPYWGQWFLLHAHRAAVARRRAGVPRPERTFFPGWRATVDDLPTPIWRTDYVLRGVALPAGAHRIELVYAPRSVRIGAAISVLALIAIAAAAVARLRRARRAGEGGA